MRVHRTFDTKGRGEALRQIKNAVAEIEAKAQRRRAGTADVMMRALLDDFTESYLPQLSEGGQSAYRDSLGLFRQYFLEERGNPVVADVRPPDVSKFIDRRRALRRKGKQKEAPTTPPSQATLQRDHRVLHTVFQRAVENRELRPDNPCTRKTRPKKGDERQPVILTPDQVESLLKECEHHPMLKLWVLVCADTGMRTNSEPLWLQWQDIDLARRRIHIVSGRDGHRTKTGKSRVIPITTDRLLAALRQHIAAYKLDIGGTPWVFHHVTTRRHHTRGERLNSLLHSFQNAARAAKLPTGVRPYDLRHTAITGWVKRFPGAIAQKAAGHASFKTTERYIHLSDEALEVLIDRPTPNARVGS